MGGLLHAGYEPSTVIPMLVIPAKAGTQLD
jgi:hypothetical protein